MNELQDVIKHDTALSKLFCRIKDRLCIIKTSTSRFSPKKFKESHYIAEVYYKICLIENFFDSVIENLDTYKKNLQWFIDNYRESDWRSFAIDQIRNYVLVDGSEDLNYVDSFGNLKSHFDDEELLEWSFKDNHLCHTKDLEDLLNIDLSLVYDILNSDMNFRTEDYISYLNGCLKRGDWADHKLEEAQVRFVSECDYKYLQKFVINYQLLFEEINGLDCREDDPIVYGLLKNKVDDLLNLNFHIQLNTSFDAPF